MLSNISVVLAAQDRLLTNLRGIESLTEVVHRDTTGPSTSAIQVTFSGVQISGLISYLYYEIYDGNNTAFDSVLFNAVPSGLDTITISGIVYTFVQTMSGLNNVPLGKTPLTCAIALYRVVNAHGTPGIDFWPGQLPNYTVSGIVPDNPLYFRATASGIRGNIIPVTTTSKVITIGTSSLIGGIISRPASPLYFGHIYTTSGNGTWILQDLPYSVLGEGYLVHAWFTNSSGIQALDTGGNLADYWLFAPLFTGITSLPYYAEVSGLSNYNAFQGQFPSNGQVGLIWGNANSYYVPSGMNFLFAAPSGTGTPTQLSGVYSYVVLGQKFDYIIFVFVSSAGSAPQAAWPRLADANGIWYFAGRTSNNAALLTIPAESTLKFSVWVGFGNKATLKTSALPFYSILSTIFIT